MNRSLSRILAALALAGLVAGCQTTPTEPPKLDLPPATVATLDLDRWWKAFGDPDLDRLVDEALANNLDLATALTRIDQARSVVLLSSSSLYPGVDLTLGPSRQRYSELGGQAPPNNPQTTHSISLQASYELDLWGKFRTGTEAARRDLLSTRYARETVQASVAAEVARNYYSLLAADAELMFLRDTLKLREDTVVLQRDRFEGGVVGELDLRQAEAERASVAGNVAAVERLVSGYESALAVLTGRPPRAVYEARILRDVTLVRYVAVPELPSGLPSDLLERRPDIKQAEARLAAAAMRIDVARADYYPRVSLTGFYGSEATSFSSLFTGPAAIWGLAAGLVQPLFGLKAIEANVEAKTAARDEAVTLYRQAVQNAFRDVRDALANLRTARAALAAQSDRQAKLRQVQELAELRYRAGYSAYLEVLDAQRQLIDARTREIIAARDLRLALVDLATALGGGWDRAAFDATAQR